MTLTQERVRELLSYNAETGITTWKTSRGRVRAGQVAGYPDGRGYMAIRIDGSMYTMHRVVFLWVHGYLPDEVDHINGDRADNRLDNLRPATRRQNMRNAARFSHNRSGVAGVFWNADKGKWTARIKVDGRSIHLGHFDNKDEAAAARKQAESRFNFSTGHGRDPVPSSAHNQKKAGRSGVKGVVRNGSGWAATLYHDRKRHYLGQFKTIEEAAAAWRSKAQELGLVLSSPLEAA